MTNTIYLFLQRSKRHSPHHQQNSKANAGQPENNSSMQLPTTTVHAQHIIHPPPPTDPIGQHISLGSHQSTQMIPQCMPPSSQMLGPTFIDPTQYLAAIPVQPVLPSGFPPTAAVISSIQVSLISVLPPLLHLITYFIISSAFTGTLAPRNSDDLNTISHPGSIAAQTRRIATTDRSAAGRTAACVRTTAHGSLRSPAVDCQRCRAIQPDWPCVKSNIAGTRKHYIDHCESGRSSIDSAN